MDEDLLAQHVDAIHGVAPTDFVAERTARARQLRQDGHRAEATAVTKLRKPTVAAWAVNQLARQHADLVDQLVEAGADLRAAQLRATSGRDADGLRPATRTVRDLAADLASRADRILEAVGAGDHHTAVEQTLFAAAIEPGLHERLRRGVFERPVEAAGFGAMAALTTMPGGAGAPADGAAEPDVAVAERRRDLEDRRAELQRAVLRQQRRADRVRERAADLQARADELHARADEAASEADTAQAAVAALASDLAAVERDIGALDETGA